MYSTTTSRAPSGLFTKRLLNEETNDEPKMTSRLHFLFEQHTVLFQHGIMGTSVLTRSGPGKSNREYARLPITDPSVLNLSSFSGIKLWNQNSAT